jgi:hypothetical protein
MARGSHGDQQLSLFNAHYDERCFLPIRVYDTDRSRPVAVVLRPGKTPSGVEVRAYLLRLTQHIRNRWPKGRAACMTWPDQRRRPGRFAQRQRLCFLQETERRQDCAHGRTSDDDQ